MSGKMGTGEWTRLLIYMVMKVLRIIIISAAFLTICIFTNADLTPREGTFTGYFFVDRWGQGVFDYFYVAPEFFPQLKQSDWRPIRITATKIRQCMNPGGAMIKQVSKVEILESTPLWLELQVDRKEIYYGGYATLTATVHSRLKEPHTLYRRDLYLCFAVHTRGLLPNQTVERDEIYDCFNNPYFDGWEQSADGSPPKFKNSLMRALYSTPLFTDKGEIIRHEGAPNLYIEKDSENKQADMYDEDIRTVMPNSSIAFSYRIGRDWLVNEYELQMKYRQSIIPQTEYILSKPISFDVKVQKNKSIYNSMAVIYVLIAITVILFLIISYIWLRSKLKSGDAC